MKLNRKIKIWLVSFGIVFLLFAVYRFSSNAEPIEITTLSYESDANDVNIGSSGSAGQVGDAKIEYLQKARFETVDAKTRKLKRVVGFEKVLHQTGDNWHLDKPYMTVYDGKLICNMTADNGNIELENVQGTEPSPKSAVLKDNVVIHIMPEGLPSDSDTFVYLDEVTFDSDRSMFFSDDDVNVVSADAHLLGKGLEIIYNSLNSRLEYLVIDKIDYVNIYSAEKVQQLTAGQPEKKAEQKKTPIKQDANAAQPEEKSQMAQKQKQPQSQKSQSQNYACLFRDNVVLQYENGQVLFADELAITDLIWASGEGEKNAPAQSQSQEQKATEITSGEPAEQNKLDNDANRPVLQKPAEPEINRNRKIVAVVTCKGQMLVRPQDYKGIDNYEYAEFKCYDSLDEKTKKFIGKRDALLSRQVSYDYTNQIAKSHGRTELVFYPKADAQKLPAKLSSQNGAEYSVAKNQAVFYGNVKGLFLENKQGVQQRNSFYGDRLVVDIAKDLQGKSDVSHISVLPPNVRLESAKYAGNKKMSHIRLKANQIDYDRITEKIIASGRGRIDYAKELTTKQDEDLCYALVEGFDSLVWDTKQMHITAASEKTSGIHIGYIPFTVENENDKTYGNKITIDTRQVDIDYIETAGGKNEIKHLLASGGIVYYEHQRYEFAGQELNYYASDDFMTIDGSDKMPCMLNGVFADKIVYNLSTGSAKGVMKGGVGVVPMR